MIAARRPAPALRHLIRYYYVAEPPTVDGSAVQPVPARSPQIIEFTFGRPYEIHLLDGSGGFVDAHPIALVGAQTFRRVELVMREKVDAFTLAFQPGGLNRLFSVPAEELTNRDFDGEAVLGRCLGELWRRLGESSTFAERACVADEYLCAMTSGGEAVSAVAMAAMAMHRSDGRVRLADLSAWTGLGVRQFERRFRYEIGITPKLYACIVRFEAALRQKSAEPMTAWTEIAHTLGYHDQMHMVHDFNRLSGGSPAAISGRLDMFVRPEALSVEWPRSDGRT